MRRHISTFRSYWDGKEPSGEDKPLASGSFEDHLDMLSKEGSWGGYTELEALSITMDGPILVISPSSAGAYDVHVFNPGGSGKQINLWYRSQHYQFLKCTHSMDAGGLAAKATKVTPSGFRGSGPQRTASKDDAGSVAGSVLSSTVGGKTRASCSIGGRTQRALPSTRGQCGALSCFSQAKEGKQ